MLSGVEKPYGATRLRWMLRAVPAAYVLPALAVYGTFVLWPLARLIVLSTEQWDGFSAPVFVGFDNFSTLWADPGFPDELRHTLLWLAVTLTVPVMLGLAMALLLSAAPSWPRACLRGILLVPLLLPTVLIAVMWRLFYNPLSGPLTSSLKSMHLDALAGDWLGDPALALPALLVVACWASFGLSMLICEAGLRDGSTDVLDAARLDGAGALARFWSITLPVLRGVLPMAVVATAFCAVPSYDLATLMTNGGPGYATTTLALDSYGRAFDGGGQIGVAAVLACVQGIAGLALAVVALLIARGREPGEPDSNEARLAPSRRRPPRLAMAALVLAAGITMAPLAWLVRLAVRPDPGTSIWAALSTNVATVWDQGFGGAFANSLWMAAAAAAATALLSLPAAFALATSRSRSLQGVAAALLALGLFQPIAVLIIPLFRVVLWLGLMDTPAGVVAPQVARVLPVAILLLWIGIRSLPGSILEAASIDGAAPRQTMVTVVVPLLWPLLVVILVWSFLVSWNDYLLPTVVIQDEGFQTIPLALAHFAGRFDTEYALLATGALVALAPVLAIYAGLYQVLARGMRRLGSLA